MKKNNKRVIVVLGMHRSGTSAITHGLEVLGASLGSNLQSPMLGVNNKGFFEDNDVVSINEEILRTLSQEWHTLSPITRAQLRSEPLATLKARAVQLLWEKMQAAKLLAIKDPRVARLLPFWNDVFIELDIDVSYVIVIRNPLSVAESLNARDHIGKEKSCYLWLEHLLPSILETATKRRVVVDFDNMVEQPRAELTRIAEALELTEKLYPDELTAYENEFLDMSLRHTKFDINKLISDEDVPQSVISLYQVLGRVATDEWQLEKEEVLNCVHQSVMYLNEFAPGMRYMTRQDWKIAGLNQALGEQDRQIANLNQALGERDRQIANLNQALGERDGQVVNLNQNIEAVYLSTSWRITKPLRELSRFKLQLMRSIQLYQNYRRIYPSFSGFRRLVKRSIDAVRKGGIKNLRTSMNIHSRSCAEVAKSTLNTVLQLSDINDKTDKLPKDVAVHSHIFYPDLAPEIRNYLANIPVGFHCYVTTDTQDKAELIETAFSDLKNIRTLKICVIENRGRDIAPMIVGLGKMLVQHEVVLHIHSKRSPHNLALRGWRRYLMMSLLGSTQSVTAILQQFSQNKQLGILYPQIYNPVLPFMKIGGNEPFMTDLLKRAGKKTADIERVDLMNFPAGGMFWFRGKAIEPLVSMGLSLTDFDVEAGQDDGTLAHAIERLFPYFASGRGLYNQSYIPKQLSSSQLGAMPLSLLHDFCSQGLIQKPVIMFDHNIGGGANHYSQELINAIITEEHSVLRIYSANESWFVEWLGVDDGMTLVALNEDKMFGVLAMIASKTIVVNSLYGYSDVDDISHRIVDLAQQLDATLDFKVHDFYAICPSQHLLDFNEKYCAVPQEHSTCNSCLKKNPAAYWASSQPVDIERWRSSFVRLFKAADIISVFNVSAIEILRKGFQLEPHKVIIAHHGDDYFKCNKLIPISGLSHVGVLGTLTNAKGSMEVNALAEHIDRLGLKIPVTVVGRTVVPTISSIKVLGNYDNNSLPEIIVHEGINVILMASIIPETFSYTISETMKMGLPIVAFDIGAQGSRVNQYELGKVVPLGSSPKVILDAIQAALKIAQELKK